MYVVCLVGDQESKVKNLTHNIAIFNNIQIQNYSLCRYENLKLMEKAKINIFILK